MVRPRRGVIGSTLVLCPIRLCGFLVVFYIRVPPIGQLNELTKSKNLLSNRDFELALPS
jgi:hypothetical protein